MRRAKEGFVRAAQLGQNLDNPGGIAVRAGLRPAVFMPLALSPHANPVAPIHSQCTFPETAEDPMHMSGRKRLGLFTSLLLLSASLGRGQSSDPCRVLYGADSGSDTLTITDIEARTVSVVGPIGGEATISIATRPSDGAVFAWDNITATLRRIDVCTGSGVRVKDSNSSSGAFIIYDLVFTPEGRLFGIALTPYEINPETGQANRGGQFRDATGRDLAAVTSAAYAPDGRLYAVGEYDVYGVGPQELGLLDVYSNLFTPIAPLDLVGYQVPQGLLFTADGSAYLLVLRSGTTALVAVDPATGAMHDVWQDPHLPQGFSYGPGCGVPVDACLQRVVDVSLELADSTARGSAIVHWTSVGETDVRGFNLVRIDDRGERATLNVALIPCEECVTGLSHSYSSFVPRHKNGQNVYVQVIRTDGREEIYGPAVKR
jgi:hypothetical protein